MVAYQLGIAHPAGSPLYALITKLFTFLPLGNIAFRANLASAFFSAFLISLTFLCAAHLSELLYPALGRGTALLCAALAAAFYAVSDSLLATATSAEVYTLQFCFVMLIGLFLVRGLRAPEDPTSLYLVAFLFGLSIGAHIIMLLFFPALCLFLLLHHRNSLTPARLGMLCFFCLLGASIYLYLPLRSSVNPYYDWGNPETVQNFLIHVTDRKDAKLHFTFSLARCSSLLFKYLTYYAQDFGPLGILLGLTGLGIFLRRNPRLFLALGVFFFSTWLFFIRLWETSVVFIPTFLLFTIGISLGLAGIIEGAQAWQHKAFHNNLTGKVILVGLFTICLAQVSFSGVSRWQQNNRAAYWSSYDFNKYLYDQIEPRGVLVSTLYYFGTSYLQQCENYRPDVTNLFLSEILKPRLFNRVTPERYPLITVPAAQGPKIGEAIINANLFTHPFYWDPTSTNNDLVAGYLRPNGLLFGIAPLRGAPGPNEEQAHSQKVEEFLRLFSPALNQYQDTEERLFYALVLESMAQYYVDHGRLKLAIAHLLVAERLKPRGRLSVLNSLASAYATIGRYTEAEAHFQEALEIAPDNTSLLQNLGQLYLDTSRTASALACYQKAVTNDPGNVQSLFGLGITLERLKKTEEARRIFQKVIVLSPEDPMAKAAEKKLADMTARPPAPNLRPR